MSDTDLKGPNGHHYDPHPLVIQVDGNAVTTSLAIAEGTEVQHKNVMELVRTYLADLQEFGRVTFETRSFEAHQKTPPLSPRWGRI